MCKVYLPEPLLIASAVMMDKHQPLPILMYIPLPVYKQALFKLASCTPLFLPGGARAFFWSRRWFSMLYDVDFSHASMMTSLPTAKSLFQLLRRMAGSGQTSRRQHGLYQSLIRVRNSEYTRLSIQRGQCCSGWKLDWVR